MYGHLAMAYHECSMLYALLQIAAACFPSAAQVLMVALSVVLVLQLWQWCLILTSWLLNPNLKF